MAGGKAPDGGSVLVVDDDDGMRSTIIDILDASGIGAHGAPDAATALEKAKSRRPAVALVDFRLPDAHGIELAAQLKALDADMSVVVLTGYATLEAAMAAVGHVDEFLTKPVPPDQLLRSVRRALDRTGLARENRDLLARLQEANATLEARVEERTREMAGLLEAAEAISPWLDVDRVAQAALDSCCRVTGAAAAGLYLSSEAGPPRLLASIGDGDMAAELDETSLGLESEIVNLDAGGRRVGTLVLASPLVRERRFLATLGSQIAFALQNAQRYELEHETVERISELSRMKSTFLAMASHELRTPLTVVLGFAETLKEISEKVSPEERADMIDRMVSHARRLTRLVTDLLDATRIESGIQLTLGRVDVVDTVRRAVDPFLEQRDIDVKLPDGLLTVTADGGRLEQVVGNFIHNAIKYSPPDTPIVVGAEQTDGNARVWVRDQGRGIDPSFLPQLFQPFAQASSDDARWDTGLGLGLYISQGLVTAMGGHLDVESEPGTGTTISVLLPLATAGA